jgi:ligand-binding SRPBCC domain-containing protein
LRIYLETPVAGTPPEIIRRFDQDLFETLAPPGTPVEIVRFEGSHTGDTVHIRLKLAGFIKQDWISKITDDGSTPERAWFVDEGTQLPFFLSYWRHQHIVEARDGHSVIIDDITYRGSFFLLTWLLYPALYLQFAWRKPIYRKIFGKVEAHS